MSDDLVKRLRDLAQAKHDDLSIGDEAAARIAELEAALRQIRDQEPDRQAWSVKVARAALEGGNEP